MPYSIGFLKKKRDTNYPGSSPIEGEGNKEITLLAYFPPLISRNQILLKLKGVNNDMLA